MLLFKVLLLRDDWSDGEDRAARLPHGLRVVVWFVDGRRPVIVGGGSDHALKTGRMNFNVKVCLTRCLDLQRAILETENSCCKSS